MTISIVLFSSLITLLTSGYQLFTDYRSDINRIEQIFNDIEKTSVNILAASIWVMDEQLLNTQLNGLIQLRDITYLQVIDDSEQQWQVGEQQQNTARVMQRAFTLEYTTSTQQVMVGTLTVQTDLNAIYARLWDKAILILLSNAIKTFLVTGFILLYVWLNITRHLLQLSEHCQNIDVEEEVTPIIFSRHRQGDEFSLVASAINAMQTELKHSFNAIQQSKLNLQDALADRERLLEIERSYKEELALQVKARTVELEQSLVILKKAQQVIIEKEKMAALGGLVSGVAHEINTPIGICLTAASGQMIRLEELMLLINSQAPSLEHINMLLDEYQQSCELIVNNVNKAQELIRKFKSIAAEQQQDEDECFNLSDTLQEIAMSVAIMYSPKKATSHIDVDDNLMITTNYALLKQVITNIVANAYIHAFEQDEDNQLTITAEIGPEHFHITVSDNGPGIDREIVAHIFEPFFTTSRSRGGTGLGLSAAYNAITLLKGTIACQPNQQGAGTTFIVQIPSRCIDTGK